MLNTERALPARCDVTIASRIETTAHCPGGVRPTYTFQSAPRTAWTKDKFRPPDELPATIPYGNMMFDRRVARGPAMHSHPTPTLGSESQAARQAEARRRAMARRKAQTQRTRSIKQRLSTPPPVEGRRHEDIQTEQYLEELFDRPPEATIGVQTDYFLDRPPSPIFIPVKTGIDVATQIYPGELFDFDVEVQPVLEVLVGKTIEQALIEVLEEEEVAAIRYQQRAYKEMRDAEKAEEMRLEELERRKREEMEKRVREQEEAVREQQETEDRVAAAVLTTGYIEDLLPSIITSLKDVGYLTDDIREDLEDNFMVWLTNEVKNEMVRTLTSRDIIKDMVKEILETRAEIYRALGEAEAAKLGIESEEEIENPPLPEGEGESEPYSARQEPMATPAHT